MWIIGPPTAALAQVGQNLRNRPNTHARFALDMLQPLWFAALQYRIDPLGMVAQAYKETGGGNYPGKVRPEFYNTAGIKVRYQNLAFTEYGSGAQQPLLGDQPLAHQMFPNWYTGARAHAQHLCAYAGVPVPEWELVDPRYQYIYGQVALGTFEELGGVGRWAPNPLYGMEIVKLALELSA